MAYLGGSVWRGKGGRLLLDEYSLLATCFLVTASLKILGGVRKDLEVLCPSSNTPVSIQITTKYNVV